MSNATTTKKRGRPALTPQHVAAIAAAPKGQPVVVKSAKSYGLAYHHKCNLRKQGVESVIVPPKGERVIGSGVVQNQSKSFALAAVGTGSPREGGKFRRVHKQIVVV